MDTPPPLYLLKILKIRGELSHYSYLFYAFLKKNASRFIKRKMPQIILFRIRLINIEFIP